MENGDRYVADHYDAIADQWTEFTEKPWKKRVLWPTVRSLLPDVSGKRVLDVGCGDGTYSAWLADRGADVLGVDLSEEMVRAARDRYGDRATFRQADVAESLAFADDQFDLVLCQHVLSHLEDIATPIAEFARVLEPGGDVVISTHHPFHDFLVVRDRAYPDTAEIDDLYSEPIVEPASDESIYHETERFEIYWNGSDGSHPGTYYRRSLSDLLQPLLDAGFDVRELEEPDLREAIDAEPDRPEPSRELLRRPPRSICLRASSE